MDLNDNATTIIMAVLTGAGGIAAEVARRRLGLTGAAKAEKTSNEGEKLAKLEAAPPAPQEDDMVRPEEITQVVSQAMELMQRNADALQKSIESERVWFREMLRAITEENAQLKHQVGKLMEDLRDKERRIDDLRDEVNDLRRQLDARRGTQ